MNYKTGDMVEYVAHLRSGQCQWVGPFPIEKLDPEEKHVSVDGDWRELYDVRPYKYKIGDLVEVNMACKATLDAWTGPVRVDNIASVFDDHFQIKIRCSVLGTWYDEIDLRPYVKPAPKTLNEITDEHYAWLMQMGWTYGSTPLEQLALICSEVGEAVNECRQVQPTEKLGAELADIILRTLGFAKGLGLDMEREVAAKMKKNKERGNLGRVK